MRFRWLPLLHHVQITGGIHQSDILRPHPAIILLPTHAEKHAQREPNIKRQRRVDLIDVLIRELDRKRFNIALEMLELPTTANREDVRGFVHHIPQRYTGDGGSFRLSDLIQHRRDLPRLFGRPAPISAFAFGLLQLLVGLKLSGPEDRPGSHGHALVFAHGQDIAFEVPLRGVPLALVDAEGREGVIASVLVGLADDPRRSVADAEVDDFPSGDHVVQRLHELGDGGCEVPPMDIEQINVVRLQLLQACLERDLQALCVVALEIDLDGGAGAEADAGGEFGRDDHLIPVLAPGHPFADPGLALFVLVVVGGVDEVPAVVVEVVEDLEGCLPVTFPHELLPRLAEIHGPKA